MSIPEPKRKLSKQRLVIPLAALAIGITYFIAGWSGGDRSFAWFGLVLMSGIGAAWVVLSRRSETLAGLLDRSDERFNAIDQSATAVAGIAVIVAVLVGFVVEIARGDDGMPYAALGAIGGVAYVTALLVLRIKR